MLHALTLTCVAPQYLEKLKEANPEEYKEVMKALQDAAREAKAGFEPQLPGGGAKLGADGVSTTAEVRASSARVMAAVVCVGSHSNTMAG